MMKYLQSEVLEFESELDLLPGDAGACADDTDSSSTTTGGIGSRHTNLDAMVSELGDILFDALMLESSVRRKYGLRDGEAWEKACEKVERRTPYMKEWGDGKSTVTNREEAIALWNEVKDREKRSNKKIPIPPNTDTGVDCGRRTKVTWISIWTKARLEIDNVQSMAMAFVAGLVLASVFRSG